MYYIYVRGKKTDHDWSTLYGKQGAFENNIKRGTLQLYDEHISVYTCVFYSCTHIIYEIRKHFSLRTYPYMYTYIMFMCALFFFNPRFRYSNANPISINLTSYRFCSYIRITYTNAAAALPVASLNVRSILYTPEHTILLLLLLLLLLAATSLPHERYGSPNGVSSIFHIFFFFSYFFPCRPAQFLLGRPLS